MDLVNLIISLISGAVGGNAAGAAMPDKSMGHLGDSIAGLIGGGLGGHLLQVLGVIASTAAAAGAQGAAPATGLDIGSILANVAGSGVGGALLTFVVALAKSYFSKA